MKRVLLLSLCAAFAALARSGNSFTSVKESGGTFSAGSTIMSGQAMHADIVPGSFQVVAGGYVWNDDGEGRLLFNDPNGGATSSTKPSSVPVKGEKLGTLGGSSYHHFDLAGSDIVPGSVAVTAGTYTFKDDGTGMLVGSASDASGTVDYESGVITLHSASAFPAGSEVTATYLYADRPADVRRSGSGVVQYSSGAWAIQISPAMPAAEAVTVLYSCYESMDGTAWETAVVGKRNWSFVPFSDGRTCIVVGVHPAKGRLAIPARLGGRTVTHIDEALFRNASAMTSLSIPAGIVAIGSDEYGSAGVSCGCLNECARLGSIKVAAGNKEFSSAKGVLFDKGRKTLYAVPPAKKGSYKVPASVRTISPRAFENSSLARVSLPKKLVEIGDWAFLCPNLGKLTIPAKVSEIRAHAFAPQIRVFVAKKNKSFSHASGGVLFDRKKKRLLHCPSTKKGTYRTPASVETIDDYAFEGCAGLRKIVLGRKVRWIGYGAFKDCQKLASISIPGKVTEDDFSHSFASWFEGCQALRRISLPNKGVCSVGSLQAGLPASCKVVYRDKTPVYWIRLLQKGREEPIFRFFAFRGRGKKLPANPFGWWPDRTFAGWATTPGGAVKYKDGATVKDLAAAGRTATLYAVWTPVKTAHSSFAPAPGKTAAPRSLAAAVSLAGDLSVDSLGDAPWTESEFDGVPCAESGAIGDGGTSVLRAEVEGPGALAFRWMASSEEGRDIAFLSVDGEDRASRSGLDGDWATVSLRVEGDGPHVLSWTYAKDASGSSGDDRARLADVVWIAD